MQSGGVTILYKSCLTISLVEIFSVCNNTIESCAVRIKINDATFVIVFIYRPHSGTIENFTEAVSGMISQLGGKLCLVGDFNINLADTDCERIGMFKYTLQTYHSIPIITSPTRFPSNLNVIEPTMIDHIWIDFFDYFMSGVLQTMAPSPRQPSNGRGVRRITGVEYPAHASGNGGVVRVCSVNVGMMKGWSWEIVNMLARRKVVVCCAQEVQYKSHGCRMYGNGEDKYKLWWSGETDRAGGVGVLVREEHMGDVVEVSRVTPRIMKIKMVFGKMLVHVYSVYAPQVGRPQEEKDDFWGKLGRKKLKTWKLQENERRVYEQLLAEKLEAAGGE